MPLARIMVLMLALAHMVGLADLVMSDACEELCKDDGCGKGCLPGAACRCHAPNVMPVHGTDAHVVAKLMPPREVQPCSVDQRIHACPDPREILHVPKRLV